MEDKDQKEGGEVYKIMGDKSSYKDAKRNKMKLKKLAGWTKCLSVLSCILELL